MNQREFTIGNNTVKVIAPKREYVCSLTTQPKPRSKVYWMNPYYIGILMIQQTRKQRIFDPSLSCLSGLGIEIQGRVTVLYGQGREAYSRPSCAQTRPFIIKVLNQEDLMGIYSPQANVVLFRPNFLSWSNTNSLYRLNVNISLWTTSFAIPLNFCLLLQVYIRYLWNLIILKAQGKSLSSIQILKKFLFYI